MSRASRRLIPAVLSIAAGASAAAAVLAIGGTPAKQADPRAAGSLKPAPALTPAQNEQPLSPDTKRELSAWATRLVRCLSTKALTPGPPQTRRREVAIRIRLSAGLSGDP